MARSRYEQRGAVAIITMDDEPTLNAISPEMTDELEAHFARAAAEARCVMLTGAGRGFSSGANLTSGGERELDEQGRIDLGAVLEKRYNGFVSMLRELPIPFVAAVNGPAAGIGCSFALMADIVVAGESAYFLQAFRRIGLVPDGGASYQLPRLVGKARAMEMMLLGEKLSARTALEWGLINRCVPAPELSATALKRAEELAAGPTKSLGLIRRMVWSSLDADWREQLLTERNAQRAAGHTADFIEGVTAFAQKRPARFKGA